LIDLVDGFHGACRTEIEAVDNELSPLPLGMLCEKDRGEFRRRARRTWRVILKDSSSSVGWRRLPKPHRANTPLGRLRHLLVQPDREAFATAFARAVELSNRIYDTDQKHYDQLLTLIEDPQRAILVHAAMRLRQLCRPPTAVALAHVLGLSRATLYRMFGAPLIQRALKSLPDYPAAHRRGRRNRSAIIDRSAES
jgi:hypothetical protein